MTQELILKDKVHIVTAFATPETVNPVSDQCEINGMPCVTNDDPLESYFFGRKGDPKKGFEWTYNFFFTGAGALGSNLSFWSRLKSDHKIGVLWANDDDGRVFAQIMPPPMKKAGFTVVDPGRFDLPSSNYTPEITKFKAEGCRDLLHRDSGPGFHRVLEPMRAAGLQAEGGHRRQGRRIPAGRLSLWRPRASAS